MTSFAPARQSWNRPAGAVHAFIRGHSKRQRITIAATFLLVLAGCDSDRGLVGPGEPRLTKQASTTLVANGTDTLDDTDAFKAALALANVVNVPAGTYYINDQITLESNNHLVGAGEAQTKIIQRKYGYNLFYAAHATNIRVEGLRFEAPADSVVNFQVGLRADNSSGVYFYNNRAINLGLIRIHNVGAPAQPNSMADRPPSRSRAPSAATPRSPSPSCCT